MNIRSWFKSRKVESSPVVPKAPSFTDIQKERIAKQVVSIPVADWGMSSWGTSYRAAYINLADVKISMGRMQVTITPHNAEPFQMFHTDETEAHYKEIMATYRRNRVKSAADLVEKAVAARAS
jgi:hypothetical protein